MLSLFAIKIFFENLIILIVGTRPTIPDIAATVISNFVFFKKFKSLIKLILFFLQKIFKLCFK